MSFCFSLFLLGGNVKGVERNVSPGRTPRATCSSGMLCFPQDLNTLGPSGSISYSHLPSALGIHNHHNVKPIRSHNITLNLRLKRTWVIGHLDPLPNFCHNKMGSGGHWMTCPWGTQSETRPSPSPPLLEPWSGAVSHTLCCMFHPHWHLA